jgi:hypothetical protein
MRARAGRHNFALLGLLLGGLRKHDPTGRDFLLLERLDDQTVAQRFEIEGHAEPPETYEMMGYRVHTLQVSTLVARVLTCCLSVINLPLSVKSWAKLKVSLAC